MNLHTRFTLDPESGFVHDNKLNTWHTTAQEVYEAILDHSADRKPTPAEVPATGTSRLSQALFDCPIIVAQLLERLNKYEPTPESDDDLYLSASNLIYIANKLYASINVSANRKPTPAEVPATGTPIESISDATRLQSICIQLWTLLDNISTASDAIKPSDEAGYRSFYAAAMKQADFRDKLLFSDGHKLFASTGLACQAPTSPLPAPSSPLQADSP